MSDDDDDDDFNPEVLDAIFQQLEEGQHQTSLDAFFSESTQPPPEFPLEYPSFDQSEWNTSQCQHILSETERHTWYYPSNPEPRAYQFSIVRHALFCNTLVALPTGLGKTLIAAVVMHNYHRWFPFGKIVFTCPTLPLVAQQMEASMNFIPRQRAVQLTGAISPAKRRNLWKEKFVFFATPHVVDNDLLTGICPKNDIVLVVIDEAHHAVGETASANLVRSMQGSQFRVLGLSATPGSDLERVQMVVQNLSISRLELRTEESLDVRPYQHSRDVEAIKVRIDGTLEEIRNNWYKLMHPIATRLFKQGAIYDDTPSRLRAFGLLQQQQKWRVIARGRSAASESDFYVLQFMARAVDKLLRYGIKVFYDAVHEWHLNCKKRINSVGALLSDIQGYIAQEGDFITHPKATELTRIISRHFDDFQDSRVIVFAEFRDCVQDLKEMMEKIPSVKPACFVGQAKKNGGGLGQKQQREMVEKFRSGEFNVLVATCVGEEGLDVGEVDLIVCYDAKASPMRMIQRHGRTGRRRAGRVVVLLTEGVEERAFEKAKKEHKHVQCGIKEKQIQLIKENPRIFPADMKPMCIMKEFRVDNSVIVEEEKPKKRRNSDQQKEPKPRKTQTKKRKKVTTIIDDDEIALKSSSPEPELPDIEKQFNERFKSSKEKVTSSSVIELNDDSFFDQIDFNNVDFDLLDQQCSQVVIDNSNNDDDEKDDIIDLNDEPFNLNDYDFTSFYDTAQPTLQQQQQQQQQQQGSSFDDDLLLCDEDFWQELEIPKSSPVLKRMIKGRRKDGKVKRITSSQDECYKAAFIDVKASASSGASADEAVEENLDRYESSFVVSSDLPIPPSSSQADTSQVVTNTQMHGFYQQSLMTQCDPAFQNERNTFGQRRKFGLRFIPENVTS